LPGCVNCPSPGFHPAKYRGIGVRIEDDVLVTARGCRILSNTYPRETKDVGCWVKRGRSSRR
jgi:Xaa-Pro aminopeptidase